MEQWSPIPDSHYSVSSEGRIRNDETNRIKKPHINTSGYCQTELYKDGTARRERVHRLVGQAFIPNPDNLPQINHKDGNKLNNNVENLEWVDNSQNMLHAYENGLHPRVSSHGMLGHSNPNGGRKGKPIFCVETGVTYKNMAEAERQTGIPDSCICDCLKGMTAHAHGLHFQYA